MSDGPRRYFEVVPIKKVDVYRSVLAQLESLIAENGLGRGDRLGSERELAERLGVSRVVVREALRALESMGKVEIRRNSGSFVADPAGRGLTRHLLALGPIDIPFMEHLAALRAAIETKVVELVAQRDHADLDRIGALLEESLAERSAGERHEGSLDLRFEAALAVEAANPLLHEVQREIHSLWVEAWAALGLAPGDWNAFHEQHVAILDALRAGRADTAVRLMSEHVDRLVASSGDAR